MASRVSDAASYRQEYRKVVEQDCDAFLRATDASGDRWRRHQILNEYGSPSALLRDYVVDNGADLVIVGTHGRSAIFDILIGSVAKQILNDAPCDILVVREPRAKVEA